MKITLKFYNDYVVRTHINILQSAHTLTQLCKPAYLKKTFIDLYRIWHFLRCDQVWLWQQLFPLHVCYNEKKVIYLMLLLTPIVYEGQFANSERERERKRKNYSTLSKEKETLEWICKYIFILLQTIFL